MESTESGRAPHISGTNILGEWIDVDYSANLLSVVLFLDPVSRSSCEAYMMVRKLAQRYEKLAVGFWFVMEPRLSCMFKGDIVMQTLKRIDIVKNAIFDGNGMVELQTRVKAIPALFVVDSNSIIKSRYEGGIQFREVERAIQARLSVSGYRDELPAINDFDFDLTVSCDSVVKQMGYVAGDYLFSSLVVPEADQLFSHPDFYLPNTIYPCGSWFVGRDFIEGKAGSTVYISCLKDESVNVFMGSDQECIVRVHTSIESAGNLILGKDIARKGSLLEITVNEFRPYEVLSVTGDSDVLISMQVATGTLKLYCVEYTRRTQLAHTVN